MGLGMVLGLGIELALGLGVGWVLYMTARICLNKSFAPAEDSKKEKKKIPSEGFGEIVRVCVRVCVWKKNQVAQGQ